MFIQANNRIGNYQVIRLIASGAFGSVFLVRHCFLADDLYALKLLHTKRLQGAREQARFLQEAKFLHSLNHAHIPFLHDVGEDVAGTPFFVQEYAPNDNLRHILNRYAGRPLPFKAAMRILCQVSDALSYTHQQRILHHDIKPENILFDAQWQAMLADFGIALPLERITIRRSAAAIGTPDYMAPEQFSGYASRRSDQYSLAVMAYELLTGQRPFLANTTAAMRQMHLFERPVPPSELNPTLPHYIDHILLKALEKRRVNRFDDIASFMDALQDAALPARSRQAAISNTRAAIRVQ